MRNFFKGFIVGIGKIIPGVSGAMLAMSLGIYDKAISSINNFRENKKENIKFLFPIVIGIILSIIIFSKIIDYSLTKFYLETMLLFVGLVIGGIPSIIKKTDRRDTAIVIVTFLFFVLISIANINNSYIINNNFIDYLMFFISGFLEAIGSVVPGISSTAMLMILGTYQTIISSIGSIANVSMFIQNIKIIIPFVLGLLIGLVLTVKLIDYLFKRYKEKIYSFILGVLSANIVLLIIKALKYPVNLLELAIGLCLMVLGIVIAYRMEEK